MARHEFKRKALADGTIACLFYSSSSLDNNDDDMWELEVTNGEHTLTASWAPQPEPHKEYEPFYRPENELFMSSIDVETFTQHVADFEMQIFNLLYPEQ